MRAKSGLREEHPIKREKDRVEVVTVHGRHSGLGGVDGKANIANLSLFLCGFHGLDGAAGAEHLVEIGHLCEGVELVEIDVIGLEQLERLLEVGARIVFHAAVGLAGQEAVVSVGRERRAEAFLRVAVTGGHIKVVDAAIDSFRHDVGGFASGFVHHNDAAEGDKGKLFAGLAKGATGDGISGGLGRCFELTGRSNGGSRDCRPPDEFAAFHGVPPVGWNERSAYGNYSCTV